MNRQALEHILRAASAAAGERELVVIGSQAILGQFPDAPETLLVMPAGDTRSDFAARCCAKSLRV